ncbi:hypothetical protein PHYBOEH_003503 [Phytophthora boehmeriae]|uniref:J domain-containing protein n=1 Tax=Phytophthora boehmeriae TaxID=109152 RepID=A0A8T1XA12_9STRA|nr:hypothetical protein PHYBOEH_003503 [Phytophthora boehmeriae]
MTKTTLKDASESQDHKRRGRQEEETEQQDKKKKVKRRQVEPVVVDLTTDEEEQQEEQSRRNSSTITTESMNPIESDDYFVVLGLAHSATEADVKRAYRKLAVQWHPDKNRSNPRAEEFFKRISEAYAVLSDPEKRRKYEKYGKEGPNQGGQPRESEFRDPFGFAGRTSFSTQHARDIFDAFFNGVDPFEAFFGSTNTPHHRSTQRRSRRDVFNDDWGQSPFEDMGFGSMGMRGFGTMGGMSMMDSFFSDGFGGGFGDTGSGGFSTSMSSSSSTFTDHNGHVVTQKTTTTTDTNGRSETVTEEFRDGKLVNSTSSSSNNRLAGAGRMQLEPNGSQGIHGHHYQRRGSRPRY